MNISIQQLNDQFSNNNAMIVFELNGWQYIDNDDYVYIETQTEAQEIWNNNSVDMHINVYYVKYLYSGGAIAVTPGVNCIIKNVEATNEYILAHEIGHNLWLYHTFETMYGIERINRVDLPDCPKNWDSAGDFIEDTPADPGYGFDITTDCEWNPLETRTDPCGNTNYDPDTHNIMSYYFYTNPACINHFTPQQIERMHWALVNYWPMSYLIRMEITYWNKYISQNISGTTLSQLNDWGEWWNFNSGEDPSFVKQEVEYTVRTDHERFLDYQSVNIKHHDWDDNNSEYHLVENFIASKNSPDRIANFIEMKPVVIKNHLISANSDASKINFHDPWYVNQNGNQLDDFQENLYSPYYPKGKYGETVGGVFLYQGWPDWQPPYYSVRADDQNIVVNDKDITWYFQRWEGDDVQFQYANSNQTAVVFKQPNAEARAVYKGHLCSDMTDAYSSNSQRKLVRTSNGKYHTVYIENMPIYGGIYSRLWYTCSASTNFNGDWNADIELPGTQNYPDMKNPSMDYHENNLAVVFESADEDDSYIILILYDPASGVYTMFEVSEIEVEYFGNARPVVAYTKREIMVIWKESSGSALKYRKLFKDDLGNWDWVDDEEDLPNSDSYSTNPTIAAVKSDSETKFYIHIAWQYSSSSIKYMEYSHENGLIQFTCYSTISSGSGFTGNTYPCISLYSAHQYPGPYPIVSWTGSKKEYIEDGNLAKTGGQCGGYVWVHRSVVRPKAGGWGSFYQTGSNVGYTNNNSTTNSSPYETIIAFSQSNGQTTKWIKRENSSYSVQTLSDNGIQTQVSNGGGLSEVKAVVFNKDDLPYVCTPSNTDFSGGLSKASAHLPVTYGRVGVVVKNNIEFVYNIGDIQLDDENILFIERDDTLAVNNLKELNDAVRTENFVLNSNCKLQFSNIYYVVNSESADSLLDKNDAVTFKVELVNADNDRVAALFDQITYDKKNTDKYENIDYQLDCAGIQSGTYYIRLVTAVKGKRDCFLSNVQNDISHLAKKNYKQVDLEEMIIPFKYELSQNYPNPFNPVTTIRYEIPEKGLVTLKVYDILGREAAVLINKIQSKGSYKVEFNGQHLSSGIYLYSLKINNFTAKKKMLLVK